MAAQKFNTKQFSAAQVTRVKATMGKVLHAGEDEAPDEPATDAEISAWLDRQLAAQVIRIETGRTDVAEDQIRADLKTEGW